MAMEKCKECGQDVSDAAEKCPHCGVDDPTVGLVGSIFILVKNVFSLLFWLACLWLLWTYFFSSDEPSKVINYPDSTASYAEVNREVGCRSKYSDDKNEDVFRSKYKNHWMIWRGQVTSAEADEASLNIDRIGGSDLRVKFSNSKAGYNLKKGEYITVKFLMTSAGGCFLDFQGRNATIQ